METTSSTVYERPEVREVTGDTIRPGGFRLTRRALSFCAFPPGARVVDVGCGVGATVEYLTSEYGLEAVGVDPSPILLELGRRTRPELSLSQGTGECLPLPDRTMDGVFAECTLSLMNADRALREFSRVLADDGRLVIADVYARAADGLANLRSLPMTSCLTGATTRRHMEESLKQHGFEILLWEDNSRLLAELTARLIFANKSPALFWGASCGSGTECDIERAINVSRPGYFLLVARKCK